MEKIKDIASYDSNKITREVVQFGMDGKFITIFKSAMEAAKMTGIPYNTIYCCCTGRSKSAGNFQWRYKDNLEK